MLADEIIASYTQGISKGFIEVDGSSKILDKIKSAHKFQITDETRDMALQVRQTKPESLLAAIDFSRPPYPLTWIEYHKDRKEAGHEDAIDKARDYESAPLIKKIGFLIEEFSDRKILIHMAYSYRDPSFPATINLLAYAFDPEMKDETWDAIATLVKSFDIVSEEDYQKSQETTLAKAIKETTDLLAEKVPEKYFPVLDKIGKMFMPMPSPHFLKTWMKVKEIAGGEEVAKLSQTCHADWWGEVFNSHAVFILMNCKNAVEVKDCEPLDVLNKRRKERGVLPIMDYKILDISEKVKKTLTSNGTADEKDTRRLHWRRGHFKTRKTGVYWWSPHLAGDSQLGMIEKDYVA